MAEYICREAIIDDLEKEIEAGNLTSDEDVWINKGLRIAIRDIKDIKTADVQPVKHAYWLGVGEKFSEDWTCSNCKRAKGKGSGSNFCSYCGARMDGDAE